MVDFILRLLQRVGFWLGVLVMGAVLVVGGRKIFEHLTYVPAQATVVALSAKCDMSYRTGRWSRTEQTVDCAQVPVVKARTPDVDWTVNRVIFVDLAYRAESGQSMTATARLGKLGRTKVAPGEKIQILRSPDRPDLVTGPADATLVAIWGMIFAIGAAMLGVSLWIKRLRNPRPIMGATPALARGFNPGAPAPINRNAQPSFEMAARTHFGRVAPTADYVRRG
jgi:hypothetical protein